MQGEHIFTGLNNIAKQQRWLTRNFWSSQSFIRNTNYITDAKTFIQNPLLSSSKLDTNIWLSNKLESYESEQVNQLLLKNTPNSKLLPVFNFFDTSRFYLNQRYNFLNQLPNQLISTSFNTEKDLTNFDKSSSYLKLNILQSYFIRNFNYNTDLYSTESSLRSISTSVEVGTGSQLSNTRSNVFVTSAFSDLLQSYDLQALNTINATSNSTQKLHLNKNFSNTVFFKS
jgi:hypothetical protein